MTPPPVRPFDRPQDRGGPALLALETGHCFRGRWFGGSAQRGLGNADPHPGPIGGEVVFHTGMTGYQEILTDPSYAGQVVVFTASHIGNYGVHAGEDESGRVHPAAIVVRDHCERSYHQRAERGLADLLRRAHVPGLSGVDTRALTTVLREHGACRGVLGRGPAQVLVEAARALTPMGQIDWVARVTRERVDELAATTTPAGRARRVAVMDFGVKQSILERLRQAGCDLRVHPARTPVTEVLAAEPDGVFLSNGPGDPARLDDLVTNVRAFVDSGLPLFGICLGHQLLARAMGAKTYKLPFGHHGANHPVRRESDRRVEITSHNHNYAVDATSIDTRRVRITHRSLNDDCLEGMELRERPAYSVQYHPEAAPGPRDGQYLFDRFVREMDARRRQGA